MEQQSQRKHILIIEDERLIGELFMDYLAPEGTWDVELVGTGERGLEKMRAAKPDILLLDILLPGIDGYEVLRQVKADPDLAEIPVLILSNLGQKDKIAKGLSLGAEDFLVKADLEVDEIRNKIKMILKKGRATKI